MEKTLKNIGTFIASTAATGFGLAFGKDTYEGTSNYVKKKAKQIKKK